MGGLQTLVSVALPRRRRLAGQEGQVDGCRGPIRVWGAPPCHLPTPRAWLTHRARVGGGSPVGAPDPLPLSPSPSPGTQAPAKKPRSRSILQSLFCCLCRDEGEPRASTTSAPLLVEENGALPKVPPPLPGQPHQPGLEGDTHPTPPKCWGAHPQRFLSPMPGWGVKRGHHPCAVLSILVGRRGGGAPRHHPADPPPSPQAAVKHLLPEIKPQDASKLCVVIDLDETLVHSSFKVGDTPAHPTPPAPCPSPPSTCSAVPSCLPPK